MPSRKRAKGKARKAAKAKKEADEGKEERKCEIETPSLEIQARMAQLSIGIGNNEGGSSCTHRSVSLALDRRIEEFINEYITVKNQLIRMGRTPGKSVNEAKALSIHFF